MTETEVKSKEKIDNSFNTSQVFSDILKPTLHDNDFLQSFVQIGIDEGTDDSRKKTNENENRCLKSYKLRKGKKL